MTFISEQDRQATQPDPDEEAGPSEHELKYRHDTANYISAMLTELRQIADKAGFEKLVGALDAAYYEAYSVTGTRSKAPNATLPGKTSQRTEPDSA